MTRRLLCIRTPNQRGEGTSSKSSARIILRVILTTTTLLLIYSYAFVVSYSLLIGGVDYVWPVKVTYLCTFFYAVVYASINLTNAWKNRGIDLSELELGFHQFFYEILAFALLIAAGYFFLFQQFPQINLTSLGWEVRLSVAAGMISSLWGTYFIVRDLLDLRRKTPVPKILETLPQSEGGVAR